MQAYDCFELNFVTMKSAPHRDLTIAHADLRADSSNRLLLGTFVLSVRQEILQTRKIVWGSLCSNDVIGHVSHVCQEDGHQNTRDTRHTCYNHWFECSERVQKFRAWEIHYMSRDSQSANECLEQLISYSFR